MRRYYIWEGKHKRVYYYYPIGEDVWEYIYVFKNHKDDIPADMGGFELLSCIDDRPTNIMLPSEVLENA